MKIFAFFLAVTFALGLPQALACSPYNRAEIRVRPQPREGLLQTNGVILIYGAVSLSEITITVDGEPAEAALIPFEGRSPEIHEVYRLALPIQVKPEPPVGAKVYLEVNKCGDDYCPEAETEYEIVAPDLAAPDPLRGLTFDALMFDLSWIGDSCGQEADHLTRLTIQPATPEVGGVEEVVVISRRVGDGAWESKAVRSVEDGEEIVADVVGGAPFLDGECWKAEQFDLLGNRSAEAIIVCRPCRFVCTLGASGRSRPDWSEVQPLPGGSCDDSASEEAYDPYAVCPAAPGEEGTPPEPEPSAGGGDDASSADSSGCAVSSGRGGVAIWLWVMSLGVFIRRR